MSNPASTPANLPIRNLRKFDAAMAVAACGMLGQELAQVCYDARIHTDMFPTLATLVQIAEDNSDIEIAADDWIFRGSEHCLFHALGDPNRVPLLGWAWSQNTDRTRTFYLVDWAMDGVWLIEDTTDETRETIERLISEIYALSYHK